MVEASSISALHPFLAVRWMAAVYATVEITILDCPGPPPSGQGIAVVDPSYVPGDPLSTALRCQIIDAVVTKSVTTQLQMCVVFADDDCVYVEPDGRTWISDCPPHGGLRVDRGKPSRGRR